MLLSQPSLAAASSADAAERAKLDWLCLCEGLGGFRSSDDRGDDFDACPEERRLVFERLLLVMV